MFDPYRMMLQEEALSRTRSRTEVILSGELRARIRLQVDTAFTFTADYFAGKLTFEVPVQSGIKTYVLDEHDHQGWWLYETEQSSAQIKVFDEELEGVIERLLEDQGRSPLEQIVGRL